MNDPLDNTCGQCRFWAAAATDEQPNVGQCRRRLHAHLSVMVMPPDPRQVVAAGEKQMPQLVQKTTSYYAPAPADMASCGEFELKDGALLGDERRLVKG